MNRSERHQNRFQTSLEKDILKIIGNKDVKDVTSADVLNHEEHHQACEKQKNFEIGEVTAIDNRKFIGAVMRYAIATLLS